MKLKYVAASKLLLSNWSIPKLDRVLEQTDIRLSRSLDFVSPNNIKVSCVQMALHNELPAKDALEMVLGSVNRAVSDGSQLIVFPEYVGLLPLLSSSSLFDLCYQFSEDLLNSDTEPVQEALSFYTKYLAQPLYESYIRFFSMLAIKASVYILAGTTIVRTREGLVNRAFLFDPDGHHHPAAGQAAPLPTGKAVWHPPRQGASDGADQALPHLGFNWYGPAPF